jgi:hypothetical protein
MKLFFAGWLVIGLALLWDRILFFLAVNKWLRIVLLVPLGEESLKIGVSYLYKLFPPLLFAFFGLGEGIYESIHQKKNNLVLILAGILPHTFFSIYYLFNLPVWLSLILAVTSHSIWNYLILNFKNDCKRSTK